MRLYIILFALFCSSVLSAQTTINTTIGSTGYTGNTSSGSNSYITFVIDNNSGNDILLTDVGNWTNSSYNNTTSTLWYSSTSLSGTPGTIGAPNWTQVASNVITGLGSTLSVNNVISNMSFLIPDGAEWRFLLHTTGTNRYSGSGATPNNFTAAGVTLKVNNAQLNGMNIGYGGGNNPRAFTGSITFINACAKPTNIVANNITVDGAQLSWTGVTGSFGYEYILDQNAASPSGAGTFTAGTSYAAANLNMNTTYYFHVRNICNSSYSSWETYSFTTLDAYCQRPTQILFSNITETSADALWSLMPTTDYYQYYLDITKNALPNSNNTISTPGITASFSNLSPNTKYYLYIRSICLGGADSSIWKIDSFVTDVNCAAPDVRIDNIESNAPAAWWNVVPKAVAYEYAVTGSATTPAFGKQTYDTTIQVELMPDVPNQYLHVRTKCNSIFTFSEWTTRNLRTTSVSTLSGSGEILISPNPVAIELNLHHAKGMRYWIRSLNGAVLKHGIIKTDEDKIDVANFPAGLYLLYVQTHGKNRVLKFTKL